jgi:hypothetical protein
MFTSSNSRSVRVSRNSITVKSLEIISMNCRFALKETATIPPSFPFTLRRFLSYLSFGLYFAGQNSRLTSGMSGDKRMGKGPWRSPLRAGIT